MKWIKLLLRNSIRMKSMQMWLKKNSPEWNDKLFWLEHGRWKIWIHFLDNSTNESIHPIGPQTPLNIPSGIPKWTRATGPDPSIGSIHRIQLKSQLKSIAITLGNGATSAVNIQRWNCGRHRQRRQRRQRRGVGYTRLRIGASLGPEPNRPEPTGTEPTGTVQKIRYKYNNEINNRIKPNRIGWRETIRNRKEIHSDWKWIQENSIQFQLIWNWSNKSTNPNEWNFPLLKFEMGWVFSWILISCHQQQQQQQQQQNMQIIINQSINQSINK